MKSHSKLWNSNKTNCLFLQYVPNCTFCIVFLCKAKVNFTALKQLPCWTHSLPLLTWLVSLAKPAATTELSVWITPVGSVTESSWTGSAFHNWSNGFRYTSTESQVLIGSRIKFRLQSLVSHRPTHHRKSWQGNSEKKMLTRVGIDSHHAVGQNRAETEPMEAAEVKPVPLFRRRTN
jgi:hypothetical protein